LKATNPAVNIEILGINMPVDYPFNYLVAAEERNLPWLQDNQTDSVWTSWKVTWRDVRILDPQNRLVAVLNLTYYDLSYASNRTTLKQLFLNAARFVDTDGDQLLDDWEIQNFGGLAAAPGEDADGDGQDNFAEYVFGTNPNDGNSKSTFVSGVTGAGASRQLSVTFRRRAGGCVDYLIETSRDLVDWQPDSGNVTVTEPFQNLFDGTGTGWGRCLLPAPVQGSTAGYLRVRAVPRSGL
jgi:hypothetical protein